MNKRILAAILALALALTLLPSTALAAVGTVFLDDSTGAEILYEVLTENTATGTGTVKMIPCPTPDDVTIPATVTYDGITYSVTKIEGRVFQSASIASVAIPGSVTDIGDSAFGSCSHLAHIYCAATTAPTLGNNVFSGIAYYTTLHIPYRATGYDPTTNGWPAAVQQHSLISGTVKDASGAAVASATVTLRGASGTRTTTTDANGAYSFFPVDNGSYSVTASKSGHPSAAVSVTVTEETNAEANPVLATGGGAAAPIPQTGDAATPYLWAMLILLAGAGLIALRKKRRA